MKFEENRTKINFSRRDVLLVIFFVLLVFFGASLGISLIGNVVSDYGLSSGRENETKILTQKQRLLEEMEKTTVVDQARLMLRVFPNNPQVIKLVNAGRISAQKHNVTVVKVAAAGKSDKTSSSDAQGTEVGQVVLELVGSPQSFIPFLQEVEETFPFSQVKDGSLLVEKGLPKLSVKIETFGRELPESLPHVNTPISELTIEEKELLTRLEEIASRQPVSPSFGSFPTGPVTQPLPGGRSNPFSL